jgi:hypothetical protein
METMLRCRICRYLKWYVALLYSSADHGCDPTVFHNNCDNKGPTVTIAYNINGNVYGGYARVSWMSGGGESVYDSDAFLFLLTGQKPCKFTIKSPEYALTMDTNCGPVFGKALFPSTYPFV